jgi:hypothetical protein
MIGPRNYENCVWSTPDPSHIVRALVRLGTSSNAALVLALQQIDLQIAAVEHDIRLMGAEPPITTTINRNNWVR